MTYTPNPPSSGQPLSITLTFTDSQGNLIKHQNYAISATQDGNEIFSNTAGHTHTGNDMQVTNNLASSNPVDIKITLNGIGLPGTDPSTWTGTKGEVLVFHGTAQNAVPPSVPVTPPETNVVISQGSSSGQACVTVQNCFSPSTFTTNVGQSVTWYNSDTASHTVTSGHSSDNVTGTVFDSGLIKAGDTFAFKFTDAGTYNYYCQIHPWMIGQVIVEVNHTQEENSGFHNQEDHRGHYQTEQNNHEREQNNYGIINPTQQDLKNIDEAKTNQTIAAEVNIGDNQSQTTSIDNNVSVQTTINNPDSLESKVTAPDQTGPKVIMFNLPATTINVANLKDLGVMYDGKLISPAPNMDAILHAKSTDSPSFAIVVTQSGVQVLVLVPHFSTHTITITNMSKVIPAVPEFGSLAGMIIVISTISVVLISRKFNYRVL